MAGPVIIVVGAVAAVGAAAGAAGTYLSRRKLRNKSILIVGPSGSGKKCLASILGDHDLIIRPSRARRFRDRVVRLAELNLKVSVDGAQPGDDLIEVLMAETRSADLICLVVSANDMDAPARFNAAERLAKLIGKSTPPTGETVLVISHADKVEHSRFDAHTDRREIRRLRDLIGARITIAGNLKDTASWPALAEGVLRAFTTDNSTAGSAP